MLYFAKRYLFIIIILIPSFLLAQKGNLSGIIKCADSSLLEGIHIIIKGTTLGTVTNKTGSYRINNITTGAYTLRASLIGYETLEKNIIVVEGNNQFDFNLKESNIDLNEVVITGTRSEKLLKDVPEIVQVINARQMLDMGITNVTEALQKCVPGIDVSQLGTRATITMQGMNSKYVLFLIDGERIAGEVNGDVDYSRLNLDNIDRIEVIKGASSSLYGSNAIGGVINIITKRISEPFDAKMYSRYSKFNEIFGGVGIGVKKGMLGSRTNFNYSRTDGYDLTPNTSHEWTQNPYSSYNFNQKFEIAPNSKLLLVPYLGYYQFERVNVSARSAHELYNDLNGGIRGKYYLKKHSIDFSYYCDKYKTYDVLERLNNQKKLISYNIIQTIRTQGNWQLSEKNVLTTGLEYNLENLYSTRVNGNYKSANEIVLFAQEDIRFGERFNVIGGIRANIHSTYGFHAAPKISLLYKQGLFNFRTSVGKGFRSPTLKELYMNFDHFGVWRLLGNPNLTPESSNYYSGSIEFSKPWNNSSITIFRNDLTNMINGDFWLPDSSVEKQRQYQNIASAYVYGVDIISKQKIYNGLWISSGYSYAYSHDNQTNLRLYASTRHMASTAVDYNFKRNNYSFTIQIYCKIMGEKFYDNATPIDKPYQNWRITLSQEYKWLRVSTGIDNVFNTILPYNLNFISPGRRFFVGLTIDFGKIK